MAKSQSKALSKASILSVIGTLSPVKVSIPELDGDIYIKQQTAAEREALEQAIDAQKDKQGIRAVGFVHSVCDAEGNLLFSDDDIEQVKQLPSKIVAKVFNKSNEVNGVANDAVDNAEKNS